MLHSLSPSLVVITANTIYTSVDLAPSPQLFSLFSWGRLTTHTRSLQSHSLTRTRSTLRRLLCSLCSLSCGLLPSSSDAGSTTGDWFIKFYAPWSVPVHVSSSSLFVCLTSPPCHRHAPRPHPFVLNTSTHPPTHLTRTLGTHERARCIHGSLSFTRPAFPSNPSRVPR